MLSCSYDQLPYYSIIRMHAGGWLQSVQTDRAAVLYSTVQACQAQALARQRQVSGGAGQS